MTLPALADSSLELVAPLGRGGMASVWRARPRGGGPDVCVKFALPAAGEAAERALLEEGRLLGKVAHPEVIRLHGYVRDTAGRPGLVLELIEGVDLRDVLRAVSTGRTRPLSSGAAAAIGASLCRALHASAAALPGGLVHRDVTPRNVLVSREGQVKLADFGVARAFDRPAWTARNVVKGKAAYMAPELLRGGALDARADLYAVGVVLSELLVGERPFGDLTLASLVAALRAGQRPRSLVGRAPQALALAVDALCAPEPARRPPSAAAAAELLARLGGGPAARSEIALAVIRARAPRPSC